jgi:8-oxo-dGTP pyrophosphatase MutT (NUDIX family)
VAAVCYRVRKFKIEFLLVRTRKGRWTFPKGGELQGLSRAQSAAVEAFEEAGVHGRIEQASFTRYTLRKQGERSSAEATIHAHLCEVLRLSSPEESDRTPTWFSPKKAQVRLSEGRSPQNAAELARVVDGAVNRIQRLRNANGNGSDAIKKVQFESSVKEAARLIARVALFPCLPGGQSEIEPAPIIEFDGDSPRSLRLGPARSAGRLPK